MLAIQSVTGYERRTIDASAAAKHAERALQRADVVSAAGDAPARDEGRRFAYLLARRVIAA
ncbi:MAG: hypothetical protein ACTHNU_13290 [Gaiellales bacterium]|jgi:hypothetical protein